MTNIPLLPYDPRKTGLRRWFTPLRASVMEYLWRRNRYTTVAFVCAFMTYDKNVTAMTVLTTLRRLQNNGLIVGRKQSGTCGKGGGTWEYTPCYDRQVWEQAQYDGLLASIPVVPLIAGGAWGHEGWS